MRNKWSRNGRQKATKDPRRDYHDPKRWILAHSWSPRDLCFFICLRNDKHKRRTINGFMKPRSTEHGNSGTGTNGRDNVFPPSVFCQARLRPGTFRLAEKLWRSILVRRGGKTACRGTLFPWIPAGSRPINDPWLPSVARSKWFYAERDSVAALQFEPGSNLGLEKSRLVNNVSTVFDKELTSLTRCCQRYGYPSTRLHRDGESVILELQMLLKISDIHERRLV